MPETFWWIVFTAAVFLYVITLVSVTTTMEKIASMKYGVSVPEKS
jgi:hypothetical protein